MSAQNCGVMLEEEIATSAFYLSNNAVSLSVLVVAVPASMCYTPLHILVWIPSWGQIHLHINMHKSEKNPSAGV